MKRIGQAAYALIQPILHLGLQTAERLHQLWIRRGIRGHGIGADGLFSLLNGNLQPVIFPTVVRALQGEGAVDHPARQGQVLVACEENIIIQLLAKLIGDVLPAGGKQPARAKIPLESPVIDADGQVRLLPQRCQRLSGSLQGRGDLHPRQVLRLFPNVHMVGHDPYDPHP